MNKGLYLVKCAVEVKGKLLVDHYGIVDVGNILGQLPPGDGRSIVVHQTSPEIKKDWFEPGDWLNLGTITDIEFAKQRFNEAIKNPKYDLFGNNCEHFARFISTGKRESLQIQNYTALGFVGVLVVAACISGNSR
jgi:hypothetical protein